MSRLRCLPAALLASCALVSPAMAQDSSPRTISGRPSGSPVLPPPTARREARRPVYSPTAAPSLGHRYGTESPGVYQGPLRHDPFPPDHRHTTYGFRNPGGVGRFSEIYPPGDRFQNGGRDPVATAAFDGGRSLGAPTLDDQARAYALGTQRYQALQGHIDAYGMPLRFGYGIGLGIGFAGAPF